MDFCKKKKKSDAFILVLKFQLFFLIEIIYVS